MDIPSSTTDPIQHSQNVEVGRVTEVEIYWPLNVNRLCEVWFMDSEQPVIPTGNGVFTGNGNVQHFHVDETIRTGKVNFRGINNDTVFAHKIDAWVNIEGGLRNGF